MKQAKQIKGLNRSEKFVIWAVRVWLRSNNRDLHLQHVLRKTLNSSGMVNAYLHLDSFMTILSETSLLPLKTGCPNSSCVNSKPIFDLEIMILKVIAMIQESENSIKAYDFIKEYLTQDGLLLIREPANKLAKTLVDSKFIIRNLEYPLNSIPVLSVNRPVDRPNRIIH